MRTIAFKALVWSSSSNVLPYRKGIWEIMPSPSRPHSWYLKPPNFLSLWPLACFQVQSSLGLFWGLAVVQVCTSLDLRVRQEGAGQGRIMWVELSIHTCSHKAPHGAEGSGGGKQREFVCDRVGPGIIYPCAVPFQHSTQSVQEFWFWTWPLRLLERCIFQCRKDKT